MSHGGPKVAQYCPKIAQDEPKMALWWPKIAPNWPKIGPRSLRMTEDRPKLAKIASRRENIVFSLVFEGF